MGIEQQLPGLGGEEVFDFQLVKKGGELMLRHRGLHVPHDIPGLRAILNHLQGMQAFREKITDEEKAASRMLNDRICDDGIKQAGIGDGPGDGLDFPLHVGLHEADSYQFPAPTVCTEPPQGSFMGQGLGTEESQVA